MSPFTLAILLFLIILAACVHKGTNDKIGIINFRDTIYKTSILSIENGDTIKRHDTIYFKQAGLKIDTSGFRYYAGRKQNTYNIYFPRDKVVLFCDSMLKALPNYDNRDLVLFNEKLVYNHIKEQASNGQMDEAIYADELSILLDRFNPFIVNYETNDMPTYMIISRQDTKFAEYKYYRIKTKTRDSVVLDVACLRPIEIKLEK